MRSVTIALALALVLLAVAIGVVLSRSPLTVAGANAVQAPLYRNGSVAPGSSGCQAGGTVPQGTTAVRISLGANIDPSIAVSIYADSRLVTHGKRPPEGGLNANAVVPVARVPHTVHGALVCVTLGESPEVVGIRGVPVSSSESTGLYTLKDVKLGMEYMQPGRSSWWSMVSSIAYHFGLGRAAGGTWIGFLAIALMLATAALASRLALEELR